MTGWRLGYALGPADIIAAITKMHQYGIMSAPTTAQYAAIEAMENGDRDVAEMRAVYDMRRRLVVDGFNKLGLTCFEPEGAFYCFPCIRTSGLTSDDFAQKLLDSQKVAVVPGNAFGGLRRRIPPAYPTATRPSTGRSAAQNRRISGRTEKIVELIEQANGKGAVAKQGILPTSPF